MRNRLRANRISGNGYAAQGGNFGIGLPNPVDADNIVEDNIITGNANGIFMNTGVHGNVIQGNLIVGNPPLQVAIDHSGNSGYDINNLGPDDGTNTFRNNTCLTSVNAPCPAVSDSAGQQ
jgi:parallel beta-helix repeat protein